jgi:hypothetical protein
MLHNLGRVVATAAVAAAVPHHEITALLDRHAAGDWGELSEDDKAANDQAAAVAMGASSPATSQPSTASSGSSRTTSVVRGKAPSQR